MRIKRFVLWLGMAILLATPFIGSKYAPASAENAQRDQSGPSRATDCETYTTEDATKTVVSALNPEALASLNLPYIQVVPHPQPADLSWNESRQTVVDRTGRLWATGIGSACSFVRVLSKYRAIDTIAGLTGKQANAALLVRFVPSREVYRLGDTVGLIVKPFKPTPTYLYVFNVDASGEAMLMYPLAGDAHTPIAPGEFVRPFGEGSKATLMVTQPFGTDHVVATALPRPLSRQELELQAPGARILGGNSYRKQSSSLEKLARLLTAAAADGGDISISALSTDAQLPRRTHWQSHRESVWANSILRGVRSDADIHAAASGSLIKDSTQVPSRSLQTGRPRIALVIGNENYAISPLKTPANDAKRIGEILVRQGFSLVGNKVWKDLTLPQMERLKRQLFEASKKAGTVVVYYAGHGFSYRNSNYFIPVDAKLMMEEDVAQYAMKAADFLDATRFAERSFLIVDACRNNRFSLGSPGGADRGLSAVGMVPEFLPKSLTFYSALPGQLASDGIPPHSPFAASLLKHLTKRVEAQEVFDAVTQDFLDRLGNVRRSDQQLPMYYGVRGNDRFYFQRQ